MPPKPQKQWSEFLKETAKKIHDRSRGAEEARVRTAVTLIRRRRAMSMSDSFGMFSTNQGSGAWIGDSLTTENCNMRCLNIVEPIINSAIVPQLVAAHVKLDIDSAVQDPNKGGLANVAKGLFEYWDGRKGYWDANLKARLAGLLCTDYGAFLHYQPKKKKTKGMGFVDADMPVPGQYACPKCGTSGAFIGEVEKQGEFSVTACPECGSQAEVLEDPSEDMLEVPEEKEVECDHPKAELVTMFEVRVDERYSQGARIDLCEFIDYHRLYSEAEMEECFGDFDWGSPQDWSYSTRWKFALETGTNLWNRTKRVEEDWQMWEVRKIYLRPEFYRGKKFGSDQQIALCETNRPEVYEGAEKNDKGEILIQVSAADKIIDVFPNGFWFMVTGDKTLPRYGEANLVDEFDYVGFVIDPHSFWCPPLVKLIDYQDAINTMYTIDIQHRERFSRVGIIYDEQQFDPDKFFDDLIPTREGKEREGPIGDYVKTFETPAMQQAMIGTQFILGILPSLGNFQMPLIGVSPSNDQNYSAQLLQKQQALGTLAPCLQGIAGLEVAWFKKSCKVAQNWPREEFEHIRTRLGQDWKDEDIESFVHCDIDEDLNIDYQSGSEIPTSVIEKEIKINQLITQIAQVPPEVWTQLPRELLVEFFSTAGVNYDVDNVEAEDRLSDARYLIAKDAVSRMTDRPEMVIGELFKQPIMTVLPDEDHQAGREFWVDKQIPAMIEQTPQGMAMVAICKQMINNHKAEGVEVKTQDNADELQTQKPMLEAQAAMNAPPPQADNSEAEAAQMADDQDARDQQMALDAAKLGAENERTQSDAEQAELQREHERHQSAADHAHDAAKHQRELDHRERIEQSKAKAAKETQKQKVKTGK